MSRFLGKLKERLRPKPKTRSVRVSDRGVVLLEGDRPWEEFGWDDVREVVTFKRDFGTYDDIRLGFRLGDRWVEVSEDVEGWQALTSGVGRHFPSIPPDWYATVMLPPFETCYRVLYERV